MKQYKRFLITSALPYANGPLHIGHLAGVYVPSDIYTRYLRAKGKDVISICGSDEHGVPITLIDSGLILISIQELQLKFIIKPLLNFLKNYTITEILLKRKRSNIMIMKQISSLQTGILQEPVLTAGMKMLMVTSVKNVERH